MDKKIKVCHFTSAHEQLDDRIYLKECISLAQAGYEVHIAARGEDNNINGVQISGCGIPNGRRERMVGFAKKIYRTARDLDCDVYHFHDPELLPYGVKLKKSGKIVIFDSHEDIPAQIVDKTWIPKIIRGIIAVLYKRYETYAVKKFDAVITATTHIAQQFEGRAKNITVINNYPKLDDIVFHDADFETREDIVCYAGGIGEERGETVMLAAIEKTDAKLYLAGPWDREPGDVSSHTKYLGKISRTKVNELYGNSCIGILLYQPAKNHFESQPIKMFEYMAAGLPSVCSNFDLWKEIIEGNDCGICVDPQDADAVAEAITTLMKDKKRAQEMGRAGYKAVIEKYNWTVEEKKLLELYGKIV